jgi:hypothetical protein
MAKSLKEVRRMQNVNGTSRKRRASSPKAGGVKRATGRDRAEWFAVLDAWGARGRPYRSIESWLTGDHGLSKWWAQKLIVEYEQARGVRRPGARRDGTYAAGASVTVAVSARRAFDAFTAPLQRTKWLGPRGLTLRVARPGRSARFDSDDPPSRLSVVFLDKGPSKTLVSVRHERLPDAGQGARAKAFWKERLARLKTFLEKRRAR